MTTIKVDIPVGPVTKSPQDIPVGTYFTGIIGMANGAELTGPFVMTSGGVVDVRSPGISPLTLKDTRVHNFREIRFLTLSVGY